MYGRLGQTAGHWGLGLGLGRGRGLGRGLIKLEQVERVPPRIRGGGEEVR